MSDKQMEIIQKRKDLKTLIENTTTITEETYTELKNIFSISEIHESVKNYISNNFDSNLMKGPFYIYGSKKAFDYIFTYKKIFKVDYDDGIFPAVYIGGIRGVNFYLMIETAEILSIHHDSLSELAWDYFDEDEKQDLKLGLNNMLKDYSLFNIDQLLKLNDTLKEYDYDDLEDEFSIKEIKKVIFESFNWTKKELNKNLSNLAMEFLYELLE